MTNTQTNSNKPVYQVKLAKGISAAVFQNTHEGRTYRSVNIQRSYRKNGSWQRDGIYLNHDQIPFMLDALERTWKYLNEGIPQSVADAEEEDQSSPEVEAESEAA